MNATKNLCRCPQAREASRGSGSALSVATA